MNELAQRAGVDQVAVSRIEKGERATGLRRKAVVVRLRHGHEVRVGLGKPLEGDLFFAFSEAGALRIEQHTFAAKVFCEAANAGQLFMGATTAIDEVVGGRLTRMVTLRGTTAGNLWLYADLGVLKTELLKGRYGDELGPILQAIGLDKADALALNVNFAETQFTCQARLFSPAPHTGLLKMLNMKPITAKDIRHMPADTDFALIAKLPFPTMLDQITDMAVTALEGWLTF